jgi:hypothetical protein
MKKLLLLIILPAAVGISFGQTAAIPPKAQVTIKPFSAEEAELAANILLLRTQSSLCAYSETDSQCKELPGKLADAYKKAVRFPEVLSFLAATAASDYDRQSALTKSAPQASQIADQQNAEMLRLIVFQNQRIIDLLEQLVKKK